MPRTTDHDLLVRIDERTERMEVEQTIIRKYVPSWCGRCKTKWLLLAPVVLVGVGVAVKAAFF